MVEEVKSVHRDVKRGAGSESNVGVYGEVAVDGEVPSGKVQTCNRVRWTARRDSVCLWCCWCGMMIGDIAEEVRQGGSWHR